jgi:hypothetical protein
VKLGSEGLIIMSKIKLHEIKLMSLRAQLDVFASIQGRHEVWVGDVDDPEIENAHRRILDLIRKVREEYMTLLGLYDQKATGKVYEKS